VRKFVTTVTFGEPNTQCAKPVLEGCDPIFIFNSSQLVTIKLRNNVRVLE